MPLPHLPAHCPPMNDIQLRWPPLEPVLLPTETFGLSFMLILKSRSREGVGKESERAMSPSSKRWRRLLAGIESFMTLR